MATSPALRLRGPEIRLAPQEDSGRRIGNPLAFLRRRRARRRSALVSGWRDEAIVRTSTRLG